MIQEAYVSFETAKLLKEKGFDEICRSYFIEKGGDIRYCGAPLKNNSLQESQHLRPTQALAMRWLREEKEIAIVIKPYPNEDGFCYVYEIKKLIGRDNILIRKVEPVAIDAGYYSYEDAVEAAIKYCLTNLV